MAKLNTKAARKKLAPRREPHWGDPIATGLFLGFRALDTEGNGTWVARYRVDGSQRYKALGSVELVEHDAATDAARAFKKAADSGVEANGVETVADACRDYVDALRKEGRAVAADDAGRRFERIVYHDRIGKIALAKLREKDVEAWRDRVATGKLGKLPSARGRPATHKPLSEAGVNRNRTALVAALNRAVGRRYVAAERAIEWESVKPHKDADGRRDLYLDIDQRRALLAKADDGVRDLMECIIHTGCRPGDPAAMLRKDYDARHGTARLRTKNHDRVVPLAPAAKALFDRLAKGKLPGAYLFANGGDQWRPEDWRGPVKAAAAAAELPDGVVLYTLRHSWITDAIVGGMDLLTVAKLAGTSLSMIEKHYGHLVHGAARDKLASIQMI